MKKIDVLVIVFILLFTVTIAPIFAANIPDTNYFESYTNITDNQLLFYIRGSFSSWQIQHTAVDKEYAYSFVQAALKSYAYNSTTNSINVENGVANNFVYGSGGVLNSSSETIRYDIYSREFVFQVGVHNYNSHAVSMNSSWKRFSFTPSNINYDEIYDFSILSNPDNCSVIPYSSNQFLIYFNNVLNYYPSGTPSLEAGSDQQCIVSFKQFIITENGTVPADGSITINVFDNGMSSYSLKPEWDGQVTDVYTQNMMSNISSINTNLQTIVSAYSSNSQNISNTQSQITDTNTQQQELHQAEQNFYTQNEQALNNVGLSNFSFDSDQSSGLGSVVTDFTTLWNNIGPLQIIFTFTLSMSLATYLLRHRPITNAIKKNEKK